MSTHRDDLLQPTLTGESQALAPYSVQTTFLTGFFGGPFAALAILATNSVRLRRISRDAALLAAILVAVVAGGWLLFHSAAGANVRSWFVEQFGTTAARFSRQGIGLVIVGIGYLLHRREQVGADLAGLTRPNGWVAGLLCAIFGAMLFIAFVAIIMG
jgi:hypothetical protein